MNDDPLTAALQELHSVPPAVFTTRRQELVRELRGRDQADVARQVAAAHKPPVTAWAVNRLREVAPTQLEALLDTGSALRSAQSRAMSGDRDAGGELRSLRDQQRDLVQALTVCAARELEAQKLGSGAPAQRRIAETLLSLSTATAVARSRLRSGTLDADARMQGFGDLDELAGEPAAPARITADNIGTAHGNVTTLVGAAERRLQQARQALDHAARVAAADQERAQVARNRVATLRRNADELAVHAQTAAREAENADTAAGNAERDAERSRAAVGDAEATVAAAADAVRQLAQYARTN